MDLVCEQCRHPWSAHLVGELLIGCCAADCHCRREPEENPAYTTGQCIRCGEPVWETPLRSRDTVCRAHRLEVQAEMQRRFKAHIAAAPNRPANRRRR